MKKSQYNFFFKVDNDKYFAYNSLKNGLALVSKNIKDELSSFNPNKKHSIPGNTFNELKKGGFLIDKNVNEIDIIKLRKRIQQFSSNSLGLTICPTLNCNLSCKYCYQSPTQGVMPDEVIKGLIKFVDGYLKQGIKHLGITWYGGEPLLCFDTIKKLGKAFLKICKKYNAGYTSYIISNGTELNPKKARALRHLKVSGVQVTIDGDRDTHNSRRPYKDGRESFDIILDNIKNISEIIPVSIRVNADINNINQAVDFIKTLSKSDWYDHKKIRSHLGYVRKFTSACKCTEDETLKPTDFWKNWHRVYTILMDAGFKIDPYPKPVLGCGAASIRAFVVGPDGALYKCYNNVGIEEDKVGNIFEPIELNPLYTRYLMEGFENDDECLKCKFLPICMGGCIDTRVGFRKETGNKKDCSQYKYFLKEALKMHYVSKAKSMPSKNVQETML